MNPPNKVSSTSTFYSGTTRYGGSSAIAKRREASRRAFFTFKDVPTSSSTNANGPSLVHSYIIQNNDIIRKETAGPQLTTTAKRILNWIEENSASQTQEIIQPVRKPRTKLRFNPMAYRAPVTRFKEPKVIMPVSLIPVPKIPVVNPPTSTKLKSPSYQGPDSHDSISTGICSSSKFGEPEDPAPNNKPETPPKAETKAATDVPSLFKTTPKLFPNGFSTVDFSSAFTSSTPALKPSTMSPPKPSSPVQKPKPISPVVQPEKVSSNDLKIKNEQVSCIPTSITSSPSIPIPSPPPKPAIPSEPIILEKSVSVSKPVNISKSPLTMKSPTISKPNTILKPTIISKPVTISKPPTLPNPITFPTSTTILDPVSITPLTSTPNTTCATSSVPLAKSASLATPELVPNVTKFVKPIVVTPPVSSKFKSPSYLGPDTDDPIPLGFCRSRKFVEPEDLNPPKKSETPQKSEIKAPEVSSLFKSPPKLFSDGLSNVNFTSPFTTSTLTMDPSIMSPPKPPAPVQEPKPASPVVQPEQMSDNDFEMEIEQPTCNTTPISNSAPLSNPAAISNPVSISASTPLSNTTTITTPASLTNPAPSLTPNLMTNLRTPQATPSTTPAVSLIPSLMTPTIFTPPVGFPTLPTAAPVTPMSNGSNPFLPAATRGRKILRPARRLHR